MTAVADLRRRLAVMVRTPAPVGTLHVIVPVVVAAVPVVVIAAVNFSWEDRNSLGAAGALLVAAMLAEAFPLPIEGIKAGATSFATIFIASAGALYGWEAGALVGALTMLFVEVWRWRPAAKLSYNVALYALSGAAAGYAAERAPDWARGLAASASFYVVDVTLLAAVVAAGRIAPYRNLVVDFFRSTVLAFAVMAATTAVLVRLWEDSPLWALLLMPPLFAIAAYQRRVLGAFQRQRELDKLKDEFVATVSHEVRTPLASVYGGAVTLQERGLDSPAAADLVAIIRRESSRLAKLVDDVLWASRVEGRRRGDNGEVGAPVECDVAALTNDVAALMAELAPPNVEVTAETGDVAPTTLRGDPEHLRRVLVNLVDNAIKYSPAGGRVTVGVRGEYGHVEFCVSDEGVGVPSEKREQIFEKFTRLDPEMKAGVGGTGLGLYICRELVEQMGGRIWVAPNAGRGSTFSFEVPTTGGRR